MNLKKSTLNFLSQLAENNDRNWFEANKEAYFKAKENVESLAFELLKFLSADDPRYALLSPSDTMFRIYRDVRFSKDKSPYKNNMGIYLNPMGKKENLPGFYVHVQPGGCFIAAGMWEPDKDKLYKIRQEIDYNFDGFSDIIKGKKFVKIFPEVFAKSDKLSRPPKGFDADNPAIEFIKLKSFVVSNPITDDEVLSIAYLKKIQETFNVAKPLIHFLNVAIS